MTAAVLALMLLIFIAQNSDKVAIHFFGFNGRISLAVALLLSAAISVLIVAIPGGARILQLRRDLKRNVSRDH